MGRRGRRVREIRRMKERRYGKGREGMTEKGRLKRLSGHFLGNAMVLYHPE